MCSPGCLTNHISIKNYLKATNLSSFPLILSPALMDISTQTLSLYLVLFPFVLSISPKATVWTTASDKPVLWGENTWLSKAYWYYACSYIPTRKQWSCNVQTSVKFQMKHCHWSDWEASQQPTSYWWVPKASWVRLFSVDGKSLRDQHKSECREAEDRVQRWSVL